MDQIRELNARFLSWMNEGSLPLTSSGISLSSFTGKDKDEEFVSISQLHPIVMQVPWLLSAPFSELDTIVRLDISEAAIVMIMAVLLHDHYRDGQLKDRSELLTLHACLERRSHQLLVDLFEEETYFWDLYDRFEVDYRLAISEEELHVNRINEYGIEKMFQIGSGKMALHKATAAAILLQAERADLLPILELMLDHFYAAMQLVDDIEDWQEDYLSQNYTYPLTNLIPRSQWPHPILSIDELDQLFYARPYLEQLKSDFEMAYDWFEQAKYPGRDLDFSAWNSFIQGYQDGVKGYIDNVHETLVARIIMAKLEEVIPLELLA